MNNLVNSKKFTWLDPNLVPSHVAIIPDGNRRWSKKNNCLSSNMGHKKGADILMDIIEAAEKIGIKTLTIYSFSTENWKRSKLEVEFLMFLLNSYLKNQKKRMLKNGVRVRSIGNPALLPKKLKDTLIEIEETTIHCRAIDVVLAINYGSRDEIIRSVRDMAKDVELGHLSLEEISKKTLDDYLDTSFLRNPQFIIRTSGEIRLSNFLLWQAVGSEVYSTDTLWPEFTPELLLDAVLEYQNRKTKKII